MGDGGSQLLGFLLAALGLASSWTTAGTTVATMLLPLLVLAIPILDTTLVTIRRLAERRPVTQGGTDHTSHRPRLLRAVRDDGRRAARADRRRAGRDLVAYNVLDRPAVTALGVLVTFALLVQFGSSSPSSRRRSGAGSRATPASVTRSPCSRAGSSSSSSTRRSWAGPSSPRTCSSSTAAAPSSSAARSSPFSRRARDDVRRVRPVRRLPARMALRDARDLATIALASGIATARGVRDRRRDARSRRLPARAFVVYGVAAASLAALPRAGSSGSSPRRGGGADDGRRRILVVGAERGPRARARPRGRTMRTSSASSTTTRGSCRRRVQGVPVLGTRTTRRRLGTTRPTRSW